MILILSFFGVIPYAHSQNRNIQVDSTNQGRIDVAFVLPQYYVIDTILPLEYAIQDTFSYLVVENDIFDMMDSVGFPQIPRLTINLNVPFNATGFSASLHSEQTASFVVGRPLLPSQKDVVEDSICAVFSMDTNYYTSIGTFSEIGVAVDEEYIVFGEKGVSISINPFEYFPHEGLVNVLEKGYIRLAYILDTTVNMSHVLRRYTPSLENYFEGLFFNYSAKTTSLSTDNYLIITAPEFESAISVFANYKNSIGYNVSVVTTNTTGTNASSIKSYIINQYDNISTRPEFVLLVGDINTIPASDGETNNSDNPITDWEYTFLDGDDYRADVFLGRFSVTTITQLTNVLKKTIFMETNIGSYAKRATLVSGHGNGMRRFKKVQEATAPYLLNNGYSCQKIYAEDGGTLNNTITALNENNWLFIYRGHGAVNFLYICNENETQCGLYNTDLNSSYANTYPICFSIACLSGDFSRNCFGESWLSNAHGGAAFFGASVSTYRYLNNIMQKKIFRNFDNSLNLSILINKGMNAFYNKKRKSHIRAYNLFGDPSFSLNGLSCRPDYYFTNVMCFGDGFIACFRADYTIVNNNTFQVNNGAKVYLQAGREIHLKDGFHVEEGALFRAYIAPCETMSKKVNSIENIHPDPKTLNYSTDETVMVDRVPIKGITIYPNPNKGTFNVGLSDKQDAVQQIVVFGILGNQVMAENNPQNGVVDVSHVPPGIYVVKVLTNKGELYFEKIIKE